MENIYLAAFIISISGIYIIIGYFICGLWTAYIKQKKIYQTRKRSWKDDFIIWLWPIGIPILITLYILVSISNLTYFMISSSYNLGFRIGVKIFKKTEI